MFQTPFGHRPPQMCKKTIFLSDNKNHVQCYATNQLLKKHSSSHTSRKCKHISFFFRLVLFQCSLALCATQLKPFKIKCWAHWILWKEHYHNKHTVSTIDLIKYLSGLYKQVSFMYLSWALPAAPPPATVLSNEWQAARVRNCVWH